MNIGLLNKLKITLDFKNLKSSSKKLESRVRKLESRVIKANI